MGMELPSGAVATFGGMPEDVLKVLRAPDAMKSGNVNLISLETIRERLGDRWEKKRDQILDQALKFLHRQFDPHDIVVPFDATHVLVIQPGKTAFTAQAGCVRAASELMRTFVGEPSPTALKINTADGFDPNDFVWVPITQQRVESFLFASNPELPKPARQGTFPVLTRMGRDLSVDLKLRPIWSVGPRRHIIGHYAHRHVTDTETGEPVGREERIDLRPADLADIDLKLLADAFNLRAITPSLQGGLVAPISYLTLTNSSTRYQLQQTLRGMKTSDRSAIVWEILDLEPGIPASRLSELAAMLRSQCRGVICRMPLTPANAAKVAAAGATLSAHPECDVVYSEFGLLKLETPLAAVRKSVPSVLFQELPPDLLPVAAFVGATHCSFAEES